MYITRNNVTIEVVRELEAENYLLIQGLIGIGFVGLTTAEFFVNEFDHELVLSIIPHDIRPTAKTSGKSYTAIMDEEIRIYEISGLNRPLLVMIGKRQPEITIYDTLNAILDIIGKNLSDLVTVGGMTGSSNEIGGFTFSEDIAKWLEERGVPPIEVEGDIYITGAVAVFPRLAVMRGIRARGLLSKTHEPSVDLVFETSFIDPLAAKRAVELLNKVYELGIPDEKLEFFHKKAENVRKTIETIKKYLSTTERVGIEKPGEEGEEDKYYL